MDRIRTWMAVAVALLVAATACGTGTGSDPGGTFRIAMAGDVDSLDPGVSYYTPTWSLLRLTTRTLVAPSAEGVLDADLAADLGEVSEDGRIYTFRLRDGIRYQPGVADGREVRSEDFRYAIERGFLPSVANGYAASYFTGVIDGVEAFASGVADHISGIDVSDPDEVVFTLAAPTGDFRDRLALPLTAPVPEEYARAFDAEEPSTYGPSFAATGPYMLERAGDEVTGYRPGRSITFVRNPNWDADTDPIRRARPDRFEVTTGFSDTGSAVAKVLQGEYDLLLGGLVPADEAKRILEDPETAPLLHTAPGNAISYVSLNTTVAPFDRVEVRQAANYVMDKASLRLVFGGPRTGEIATHALLPGWPAFDAAGGGTYDPYASDGHAGDVDRARELMSAAGYADGSYDGPPVPMVEADDETSRKVGDVVQASLEKIGIGVERTSVDPNTMFSKYLSVPDSGVAIGANAGWTADFPDPVTVLKPLFDGRMISPQGTSNFSLLDDAELNALIDQASDAVGDERTRAWAAVDERVMELAPIVPWLWPSAESLVSPRVSGYRHLAMTSSIDLGVVSLTAGG